jgi:hypothetical protein
MNDYTLRDETWIKVAHELYEAQKMRKYYTQIEDKLHDILVELSKGESSVGSIYRFAKIDRKGSVDYTKVTELIGVNLESYRKPSSTSWKLTNDNVMISGTDIFYTKLINDIQSSTSTHSESSDK